MPYGAVYLAAAAARPPPLHCHLHLLLACTPPRDTASNAHCSAPFLPFLWAAGGVVKQLLDECGEHVGAYRVFRRGDDVLPGLAMSRSLGDIYAHAVGVTCEPHITCYTLSSRDLFLVFATDGVCDVMSNEEVVDFVERYKQSRDASMSCAEALTLEAQERWKARHNEVGAGCGGKERQRTAGGGTRCNALARQALREAGLAAVPDDACRGRDSTRGRATAAMPACCYGRQFASINASPSLILPARPPAYLPAGHRG